MGYAGLRWGLRWSKLIRDHSIIFLCNSFIEPACVQTNWGSAYKITVLKMTAEFPVTKTITTKIILQCNFLSVNNKQNNDMIIIFDTLSAS